MAGIGAPGADEWPGGFDAIPVSRQIPWRFCVLPGGGIEDELDVNDPTDPPEVLEACPPRMPAACGAKPLDEPACPQLAGDCIVERMWRGQSGPEGSETARPNMFTSQAACDAGRARAETHPGVEDDERSLGECRQVCGGDNPCPCSQEEGEEGWIVDTDPAAEPSSTPSKDSMADTATAERHGGTCA